MSSLVKAALKGTLGLLVNKGRQRLAEKLKDGDATDQQLRSWIIKEFDNVNSKLDAMARSDLGASISFFKEGVVFLDKAMDCDTIADTSASALSAQMESEEKKMESPLKETELSSAGVNTTSLVEEIRKLQLTNLDKSGKEALFDAKKRFEDARRKATEAFSNEALTPSDRILAMAMRLMATILEKGGNPANLLAACRSGLAELHSKPFVRENFKLELTGGVKAKFKTDERRQIISLVCQVNRIIYDVFVGENQTLLLWPCIGIGNEKVDPLRDSRVAKTLRKLDMGDRCVAWSFGHEGQKPLKSAKSLATNSVGEFLVADIADHCIKVFDATGTFRKSFGLPAEVKASVGQDISAVATDRDENIYILVNGNNNSVHIYVFNKQAQFSHNLVGVATGFSAVRVMVKDDYLFLPRISQNSPSCDAEFQDYVMVCKRDGTRIGYISEQTLEGIQDVTAVDDGRIMVLDSDSNVYVFADVTADHGVDDLFFPRISRFLSKFPVARQAKAIAFHSATGHVIIASQSPEEPSRVSLYSKDGDFEHSIDIGLEKNHLISAATVTTNGRLCVVTDSRVHVL